MKKRNKSIFLFSLIFFFFMLSFGNSYFVSDFHSNLDYNSPELDVRLSASDLKIHILGNEGWREFLEGENLSGFGNSTHPYVLKNLEIDSEGIGSGIIIEQSNVYFKIENCTIIHSGNEEYDAGIKLISVTNGILINNNITYNEQNGIAVIESYSNVISENLLSSNNVGVLLVSANYNTVLDNVFSLNEKDIEEYNCTGNIFAINPYIPYEIIVITIVLSTVGLSCSIAIPIIYHNVNNKKKSKKELLLQREDKIYKRDKLLAESSKSLLAELINKELMFQAVNVQKSFKTKSPFKKMQLSTISDYFLNKVDSIGFNVEDKKEFLKEMFTFTPKERLEIVDDILEKMKTNQQY